MNHEERTEITSRFFRGCLDIQNTKGKDYTTEGDAWADLKLEAEQMDISPEKVLWISMNKHYKAVRNFCKNGQTQSEPIEGRLKDLANYVSLLYAFTEERKRDEGIHKQEIQGKDSREGGRKSGGNRGKEKDFTSQNSRR